MFTVINDCNALGEFAQWAQNVIDEESDKSDLLSKLIGDDGTFASSIKMTVGEANIHSLDIEYIDGLDGTTRQDSIVITLEDGELSEAEYDDFCKAIYVGMCSACLSSEQLAKTL